jgi:hypothetical protein
LARGITSKQDLLIEEGKWLALIPKEEIGKKYYNLLTSQPGHWTATDRALSIVEKISRGLKGLVVYTDGVTERKFRETDVIPEGFFPGRLKWDEERRQAWTGDANPMKGKTGESHHLFGTHQSKGQKDHHSEVMKAKYSSGELEIWNKGIPSSEESKELNRQAHLGRHHSEESKAKCAIASLRGNTPEHNAKLAALNYIRCKGVPLSEEHKQKLRKPKKKDRLYAGPPLSEDWGIMDLKGKKPSFMLRMALPDQRRRAIGTFPTIEEARIERDRLCELHGIIRPILALT